MSFEHFVDDNGRRLRAALVSAYGPDVGADAAAEALAYGWANWGELQNMANPTGYLYRVGQSAARRHFRPEGYLPGRPVDGLPHFEPGLAPALEQLTERQRVSVIMIHALGWTLQDTADLLDVSVSTVRTHLDRAMTQLRHALVGEPTESSEAKDHA